MNARIDINSALVKGGCGGTMTNFDFRLPLLFGVGFAFRFAVTGFVLMTCLTSCGNVADSKSTPTQPPRTWDVSISNLLRTASEYKGQRVRVRFNPGSYSVRRGQVLFGPGSHTPPAAVFECRETPKDSSQEIIIIGTVDRIERDGIPRYIGVEHCVYLSDCSISASP